MPNIKVLVVAGGGGTSGILGSGGAGAGGLVYNDSFTLTPQTYAVTVGNGGVGANQNGQDSVFSTITANGGGYGGSGNNNGGNGGCGGGAGSSGGTYTGGTGSQGYKGGNSYDWVGGGGGGMGGAGPNYPFSSPFNGKGLSNSITGSAVTYCEGGNSNSYFISGNNGTPNTGNGASASQYSDQNGGSGIVILRWLKSDFGTCSITGTGNTITDATDDSNYSVAKFIIDGTITFTAGASPSKFFQLF